MAGKTPAELKSEGEELKALFAKIKKKPHNCAILVSKDGIVVEAHIKKSAEILVKAAKKNGGMAKGAWGAATMEGQVLILDPINEKVPGNLGKIAKKFFTERGLKLRLEIKEPEEENSEVEAESVEENQPSGGNEQFTLEEESSVSDGGIEKEEIDKRADLEKRLEDIQDDIDELEEDTKSVMHSALIDALRAHERNMEAETFDRAEDSLKTIATVLEDYEGLMVEKRPLMKRFQDMFASAKKVTDGDNSEAADSVARAQRAFDGAIDNNEWIGAREQLDRIEEYIKNDSASGEEESPSEDNAPPDTTENESSTSGDEKASDAEDSPSATGGSEEVDSRRADMERRMAEIQNEIDELEEDTSNVMHSSLIDALRKHERAMEEEDFERANDAFATLQSVLADYEGLLAEKRPLMQRMAKMEANAQKIINGDNAAASEEIARAQRAFVGAIDNNEWFGAGEQLNKIEEVIDSVGGGGEDSPEEGGLETDAAPEAGQMNENELADAKDDLSKRLTAITPLIKKALKVDSKAKEVGDLVIKYGELFKGGDMVAADEALAKLEATLSDTAENSDQDKKQLSSKQRDMLKKKMVSMQKELSDLKSELDDIVNSEDEWDLEDV